MSVPVIVSYILDLSADVILICVHKVYNSFVSACVVVLLYINKNYYNTIYIYIY